MKCQYGCGKEAVYQLKNEKWCCSKYTVQCKAVRAIGCNRKKSCQYCNQEFLKGLLYIHEQHCYLNPKNLTICPVCDKPIKNYKESKTCSHACANTYFRSGEDHPNCKHRGNIYGERYVEYRQICFEHHEKKCIVCGEENIVAVHHYDKNHDNISPENLIPLCPTHHCYWHSNTYKSLIEDIVEEYRNNFISR